ncbi:g2021 [Coccomyxa viridis]|uniref:G2021 protein n=1 Tax=Coccomyxa viridis TaxID=1274662 RepID=A0ABP1FJD0_9CHLO
MSPKRSRHPTPEDDDKSGLERKSSLSRRSNSLRGLRFPRKTHEAPSPSEEESFKREWGMTMTQENELLKKFRDQLKQEGILSKSTDMYFLRRFLRARQHDLKKARDMYAASVKWRGEFGVDTILEDFHFHERDAFISLYPQGYHKTDKSGRPIFIQHLGAINYKKMSEITTEDRMIRFHVQEYERCARCIMPACSIVAGRHIDQTFAIIDVKGVGLKHLTGDIKRMLARIMSIDQNNYPEMLGHTCIINAPGVFKLVWSAIKGFIDPKTQEKIEMCPTNYTKVLLQWIEPENLPEYLGGTSKATLLDDAGPWQDPKIVAEVEAMQRHPAKDILEEEEDGKYSKAGTAKEKGELENGEDGEDDRFLEIPPISTRRSNSMRSDVSGDDDAFYSPKSSASFSSDASFVSSAENLGRSPFEGEGFGDDLTRASSGPGVAGEGTSAGVSSRVKKLEEKIPELQAKLRKHMKQAPARAGSSGADGLNRRVEVLEDAVDTLLDAEAAQLKEQAAQEKACCRCCSIM